MIEDSAAGGVGGDRATGPDAIVPGAAATAGPVRDRLLDLVIETIRRVPSAAALAALEAFLTEPSAGRALALWFGADAAVLRRPRPGRDRAAAKRQLLQAIDRDIARIDAEMTAQVNAILHHRRFQRLEASWRGIAYLVALGDADDRVRLRVLDLDWAELCRDLDRAMEFDQSALFSKIYSEEFGMPGGVPFGVLIGDYEVRHRRGPGHPTDDVAALKSVAQVAAAAFAPFIVGCSPVMFGIDSFAELGVPIDLGGTFRHIDYARWNSFQEAEDSRFVGLALPRILMRRPHADLGPRVVDGFRFQETVEGREPGKYLWGTAVYAFAGVLIRAFSSAGWFAEIRGAPRDRIAGGLVTDLPVPWFATDREGIALRYSTDVSISDRQDTELSSLGFIPLSKCKDTEYSVFYGNQSAQRAKRYDRPSATINAQLSAMLQYILCVSRFSHYVKVIGRDRIGALGTPGEVQDMLQRWLQRYTTANDDASLDEKARFPLRDAAVQVREQPGRPGSYGCTIHLKPHFQLDQVVSSFKLVTELTSPLPP